MCAACNTKLLFVSIIIIIFFVLVFVVVFLSLKNYTGTNAAILWAIIITLAVILIFSFIGCAMRKNRQVRQKIIYSH